jgi:hypothetical protein
MIEEVADMFGFHKNGKVITALRSALAESEALAEPVKQSISEEAFNWIDANAPMFVREAIANTRSSIRSTSEYSEQAEQEPVAWHEPNAYGNVTTHKKWAEENGWLPLYAAPVRTKDLTDDEISDVFDSVGSWKETLFGDLPVVFARAVIAKFKEKNNV